MRLVSGGEFELGSDQFAHAQPVHPGDQNVAYFAGFAPWRSDWLSFTWTALPNQHRDQHALVFGQGFQPTDIHVIAAHDGGVSTRPDAGGGWIHKDGTTKVLSITQFCKGAVQPYDSSTILGGTQDNGSARRSLRCRSA